jgi:hypothetical protein
VRAPLEYAGGRHAAFELVLIGRAGGLVSHLLHALREAGTKGIGARRSARLSVIDATGIEVLPALHGLSMRPNLGLPLLCLDGLRAAGDARVDEVTLDFLTPLRMKKFGEYQSDGHRLGFPGLFGLLLRRIEALTAAHCSGDWRADARLLEAGRKVRVKERNLRFTPLRRYSNRHRRPMPLHGIVGSITFAGPLGPFMPVLRIGELIHVGAAADLGLGRYQMTSDIVAADQRGSG